MAEKEKKKSGEKKPKLELHSIRTSKADDGTFVHEHEYKSKKEGEAHHHTLGGTSSNLADIQQHMADHFGPDAQAGEQDDPEPAEGQGDPAAAQGGAGPAPAEGDPEEE